MKKGNDNLIMLKDSRGHIVEFKESQISMVCDDLGYFSAQIGPYAWFYGKKTDQPANIDHLEIITDKISFVLKKKKRKVKELKEATK